jgi:MarR family transcriptional regulator, 2-MHQ and catechol-resistance regulon repressor
MGTNYKGTKKEIRALDTYIKLIRASDSVTSRINTSLSAVGLTESQFNVLDALYHLGSLSQRELGRKLLKSGGNITMVIDNLEKTGLVERRKVKEDRRQYKICLTRKGKERIGKIIPQQVKLILKEMKILNESEQIELQRLCKKIGFRKG